MFEVPKEIKFGTTINNNEVAHSKTSKKRKYLIGAAVSIMIIVPLSVLIWYFVGRSQPAAVNSLMTGIPNNRGGDLGAPSEIFNGTGLRPFPISMNPQACQRLKDKAILQPPDKFTYIGFHVDFSRETPLQITRKLQYHAPSVINAFIDFGSTKFPSHYDSAMFDYFAEEVSRIKGILMISLIIKNMEAIPDSAYTAFATQCYQINRKLGVAILLRYGPEMNGPWMDYGLRPVEYKASFIKMANAVHALSNITAMMWAPNVGHLYPFGAQLVDFKNLDTNGDQRIDNRDDPYLPYYPGDEYVDWVGISSYWYPNNRNDFFPIQPYFQDALVGSGPILDQMVIPNPLFNFYGIFAEGKNKPMAVAETGAPVSYNGVNGQPPTINEELTMKQRWWRQSWDKEVHERFPLVKLILTFEEAKFEDGRYKDWRVTANQTILDAYIRDNIQDDPKDHIIWSTDIIWNCTGYVSCYSASCLERNQ